MNKFILNISFLCFLINNICVSQSITQNVISFNSFSYSNENIHFEHTIGELSHLTIKNKRNSISQGFHQNFKINNNNIEYHNFSVSIYPNPTHNFINLHVNNINPNLNLIITDKLGNLLSKHSLHNEKNTFSISNLSNGTYYLNILKKNKLLFSKKIIKL